MIKDILNSNEEILPNTKQIEVLKENFPACFNADGSFDIERFKEYLSDKLMVSNEGYELKFLGKNYTVHFRDQLGNKQMAQIISEVMRGEN